MKFAKVSIGAFSVLAALLLLNRTHSLPREGLNQQSTETEMQIDPWPAALQGTENELPDRTELAAAANEAIQVNSRPLDVTPPGQKPSAQKPSSDFEFVFRRALGELPRRERIEQMEFASNPSVDLAHGLPESVRKTGEIFGNVARILQNHSDLAPLGQKFYSDCASSDDLPDSVRAQCLHNAIIWSAKMGISSQEILAMRAPARIIELSFKLNWPQHKALMYRLTLKDEIRL